jgi:hypothetical protein
MKDYILKPMTFNQYKSLTPYKQYELLVHSGVIVANRISTVYKFILYQIDSFYVEVKSDLFESRVEAIKCFFDTKELDPYLGDISLQDLV